MNNFMNNFFSADLIFFIMVAVILVVRLRKVLGKITGNEKKSKNSFLFNTKQAQKTYEEESAIKKTFKEKTQVQENINNTNVKLKTSVEKINEIDKKFSTKEFLRGAQEAFELILSAVFFFIGTSCRQLVCTS